MKNSVKFLEFLSNYENRNIKKNIDFYKLEEKALKRSLENCDYNARLATLEYSKKNDVIVFGIIEFLRTKHSGHDLRLFYRFGDTLIRVNDYV